MLEFLPCGDTAVTVQFGEVIDRGLCMRVLRLREALLRAALPGVLESVPTYRSLLVHYDPLVICQEALKEKIASLAEAPALLALHPKRWSIPVCFSEEFAWDFAEVAGKMALSEKELLALCTETEFFIYMIGFSMGLLYLGDLPELVPLLRRENPRTRLEKGAVAVAQGMAVIYPVASPGGWNVIGNTPISLFDIGNSPPSPFTPGDFLHFQAVDAKEYAEIADAVAAGGYQLGWQAVGGGE